MHGCRVQRLAVRADFLAIIQTANKGKEPRWVDARFQYFGAHFKQSVKRTATQITLRSDVDFPAIWHLAKRRAKRLELTIVLVQVNLVKDQATDLPRVAACLAGRMRQYRPGIQVRQFFKRGMPVPLIPWQ